ncbi:MAG: 1-phosphofructokinase family hexose kinase [Chloroflexi bacterium]|nr:1-phosphofructokinase family hexose kinase [Chloroflexota bacterium]
MMIYTLTPNPSIDRLLTIDEIRFNTVLRSNKVRQDWGGKGFNISRALRTLGIESIAMGWVGGETGKMLADGLQKLGIQTDFVWVDQDTRINTMIIEQAGEWHVKVNEPGPLISNEDIEQMHFKVSGRAKKGDVWVLSGSLPPDVPDTLYAELINLLKRRGARVYLDAQGEALRNGCLAVPYLVKPNASEAAQIVGFPIENQEDAKRAALYFLRMGIPYFALALGAAGLLLATRSEMVFASSPRVQVRNAAGAGDALMAGMIYAQMCNMNLADVARWGVAAGSASVETEGVSEFYFERAQTLVDKVIVQ